MANTICWVHGSGNSRKWHTLESILTGTVEVVEIQDPRNRNDTFEPQLVKKRHHLR